MHKILFSILLLAPSSATLTAGPEETPQQTAAPIVKPVSLCDKSCLYLSIFTALGITGTGMIYGLSWFILHNTTQ